MNLNYDGKSREASPFLLKPVGKDYLWGGNKLNDDFSKGIAMDPLAETWECSTHPDGISVAASGELAGVDLKEILKLHPEYLGIHIREDYGLPILVKLIDANRNLSVQVHPSDEYAFVHEGGQLGKTEMWYVLDAARGASIVYGFDHNMDRERVLRAIKEGSVEQFLQKVHVKKNDVFYILPGTVHAIGAGVLIAEIQENSNLTYRLYDYNRTDKYGIKRELHVKKAMDVINFKSQAKPIQPMRVMRYHKGFATDLLCRCKYFQVERLILNTESTREMANFRVDSNSFQVFLCTDGCGVLFWDRGGMLRFYKGDCIFIPANSIEFKMHGKAQILKVSC